MDSHFTQESFPPFFDGLARFVAEHNSQGLSRLHNFFDELTFRNKLHLTYRKEAQRRLADDFNTFDWIAPDENKLSSILAALFQPAGLHGQGPVFLSLWLNMLADTMKVEGDRNSDCQSRAAWWRDLAASNDRLQRVNIYTESPTSRIERSQRRMDIHLVFDEASLVIENKFGAGDQQEQVRDYAEHISRERPKYLLVYLNNGTGPAAHSIKPDEWDKLRRSGSALAISHRFHVAKWLEQCMWRSEADKIRWFLRDFRSFIENCTVHDFSTMGEL